MRSPECVQRVFSSLSGSRPRPHGQTLVEFALVLPVLLALTICVIDVGRGVAIYNLTSEAARSGARVGRINPDQTTVVNAVKAELGTLVANPSVTVNQISSGGEPYVEVTVSSVFTPLTLQVIGLTNNPMNIAATSRQYMYNVVAAGGTPFPTITPNATAFVEATQTAQANLTATALASSLTATAAAGGPTATPVPTAATTATPTPNAAQTAIARSTATALAALPTVYPIVSIPDIQTGTTSNLVNEVACGRSGTLTSTIIAWTAQASTGLRARLVPIGAGTPSAWQNIPSTGATLDFPVAAGTQYRVEVENTGTGNSANKIITIISQPVIISCPTATP